MVRRIGFVVLLYSAGLTWGDDPQVRVLAGHTGTVRPAFAPNGKTIATASDDETIKLWDAASGRELRSLPGHASGVWRLTYSPDSKVLAAVADKRVFLWNPATGDKIRVFAGHSDTVRAIAFSPDGKTLATGGNDETVRLWDVATGEAKWSMKIVRQGELWEGVWSLAFAPDGRALAVGSGNGVGGDGHVRVVAPATGTVRETFVAPGGEQVWAVTFSPDGKHLASGTTLSGRVTVRATDTWKVAHEWTAGGTLRALAYSPDGKTMATAMDRVVMLWDAATGVKRRALTGHGNWVMQVAFSPDGKLLVSGGSDNTARLWKVD